MHWIIEGSQAGFAPVFMVLRGLHFRMVSALLLQFHTHLYYSVLRCDFSHLPGHRVVRGGVGSRHSYELAYGSVWKAFSVHKKKKKEKESESSVKPKISEGKWKGSSINIPVCWKAWMLLVPIFTMRISRCFAVSVIGLCKFRLNKFSATLHGRTKALR